MSYKFVEILPVPLLRIQLNKTKSELYELLSRKRYERIIREPESITLNELLILSNFFGINHIELLKLMGYSINDISKKRKNEIDGYISKCMKLVQKKNFPAIVKELNHLEKNNLTFENIKYLNIWIVLKVTLSNESNNDSFKTYQLTREQLQLIIDYYVKRKENNDFVLLTQDLQLLINVLSDEHWNIELVIELINIIID